MQGASDTNSWYDCYRGLRNKLNLEGTEMGEITLVTDFFDIGRGQDKNEELRRTASKYFDEFRRWARIQNKLIVYTDSKSAETIKAIRAEYGLLDKTVIVATDNLFELEGDLLARMEKASRNQDFLDFRYLPEASSNNPKYDYLWMMKYYFMNDAYEFLTLAGGIIITFAKEILDLIMVELLTVMRRTMIFCGIMILMEKSIFHVCMTRMQGLAWRRFSFKMTV